MNYHLIVVQAQGDEVSPDGGCTNESMKYHQMGCAWTEDEISADGVCTRR